MYSYIGSSFLIVFVCCSGYFYAAAYKHVMFSGSEVFSFSVSDPENDPLSVSINHDKKFYLEQQQGDAGSYKVRLKERLDRETENRYTLVITIDDSNGHVVSISFDSSTC